MYLRVECRIIMHVHIFNVICNFDSEMTVTTYTPISCILAETLLHTLAYDCYVLTFLLFFQGVLVCIPLISTKEVE